MMCSALFAFLQIFHIVNNSILVWLIHLGKQLSLLLVFETQNLSELNFGIKLSAHRRQK